MWSLFQWFGNYEGSYEDTHQRGECFHNIKRATLIILYVKLVRKYHLNVSDLRN